MAIKTYTDALNHVRKGGGRPETATEKRILERTIANGFLTGTIDDAIITAKGYEWLAMSPGEEPSPLAKHDAQAAKTVAAIKSVKVKDEAPLPPELVAQLSKKEQELADIEATIALCDAALGGPPDHPGFPPTSGMDDAIERLNAGYDSAASKPKPETGASVPATPPKYADRYEAARLAMWARVQEGAFNHTDLQDVTRAAGLSKIDALRYAMKAIEKMKAEGSITFHAEKGPRYGKWTHKGLAPVVAGPYAPAPDTRLYDPPAALEGPNNGLTEEVADRLWRNRKTKSGFRGLLDFTLESTTVKNSWRETAADLLDWMYRIGFSGPAGPPRRFGERYSYAWNYECANWEIVDEDKGCVATIPNEEDVPLLMAAPRMMLAIAEFLLAQPDDAEADPLVRGLYESIVGISTIAELKDLLQEVLDRGVSMGVYTCSKGAYSINPHLKKEPA